MKADESRLAAGLAEQHLYLVRSLAPTRRTKLMRVRAPELGIAISCVSIISTICAFFEHDIVPKNNIFFRAAVHEL